MRWIDERLGKGIVKAQDTVNFIGNRIGVFGIQSALRSMAELDLNLETIDSLTGPLIGRAKSANFRTADVVGLDVFAAVAANTKARAPDDPYNSWYEMPSWLTGLIEAGHLGQKTGGVGLYKKTRVQGKTKILAYRPSAETYAEQDIQSFPWQQKAASIRDTPKRLELFCSTMPRGASRLARSSRRHELRSPVSRGNQRWSR